MVLSGPPPEPLTTRVSSTTTSSVPGRGRRAGRATSSRTAGKARLRVQDELLHVPCFRRPPLALQAAAGGLLRGRDVAREAGAHGTAERLRRVGQVEAVGPFAVRRQVADDNRPAGRQVFLQLERL